MGDWRDVLDGRADYAIVRGDALASLRVLPDKCIPCVCTSPPYYGLRDYGLPPSVWGGRQECDHIWGGETITSGAGAANKNEGFNERWGQGGGTKAQELSQPIALSRGAFCVHCNAWRGCLGLEPTPDCGRRGKLRLRKDLTPAQRLYVAQRLLGVEVPHDGERDGTDSTE